MIHFRATRLTIVSCALLSGITGCAPLQQAPLVYSSKTAAGFEISTTSTETPGISVIIGFKQVEAAYVPVAVAKPCEDKTTDCTKDIYKLHLVTGGSNTEGSRRTGASAEEAQAAIDKYTAAQKKVDGSATAKSSVEDEIRTYTTRKAVLSAKVDAYDKEKASYQKASMARDELQKKRAGNIALTEEETKQLAVAEDLIKKLDAARLTADDEKELGGLDSKISVAQSKLKTAIAELTTNQTERDKLKPSAKEAEQLLDTLRRTDAFSVYGRFESSTGAESAKVSVGLGKIFSTGVASQNLSAGLQRYYENLGVAQCYDSVAKLSDVIKDQAKLEKLIGDCRTLTTKTVQ